MNTYAQTSAAAALVPAVSFVGCLYCLTTSWVPANAVDQFLQMRPLLKPGNVISVVIVYLLVWLPAVALHACGRRWVLRGTAGTESSGCADTSKDAALAAASVQGMCMVLGLLMLAWVVPDFEPFMQEMTPEAALLDVSHAVRSYPSLAICGMLTVCLAYWLFFRWLYRSCGKRIAWCVSTTLSVAHGCVLAYWTEDMTLYFYVPMCIMDGGAG